MDGLDLLAPPAPAGYAPLTIAVISVCSIFPALAIVSVIVRFWCRRAYNIPLKADDWVMIPALLLTLATCGCGIWGAVGGRVGSHDINETDDQVVTWLKAVYFLQIVYIAALPMIKLSILLFYNRIFQVRTFRLMSYGIAAFLVCWFIAFELTTIFQCLPISANWMTGLDSINYCINEYVLYDVYSATNLLTDIVILAMPWPMVMKLHVAKQKKVQLLGIFLLGSFICMVGAIHLAYVALTNSMWFADTTNFQGYIFIWFCIEPCTGIICACLPTLSPIIVKASPFSRVLSSIREYLLSNTSTSRTKSNSRKTPDVSLNSRAMWSRGFPNFEDDGKSEVVTVKAFVDDVSLHDLQSQRSFV